MPEATMSTTTTVPQITLPGQAHTAEGPHDLGGMYVMHHAFRRDLDRFVSAVRHTPVGEAATWAALQRRFGLFDESLHHHHEVEDASIWPLLLERANAQDRATLEAMEAEHATIDPALEACRTAFAEMVEHPCTDHRNALDVRLTALRAGLVDHLRHEETEALPLVQRTMTAEEWAASEKAAGQGYPLRLVPFLVCWTMEGMPDEIRRNVLGQAGALYGVLLRLFERRHARREAATFRWSES
jgi:iron-sulfur cluster repair protein YtfE (RIC family)